MNVVCVVGYTTKWKRALPHISMALYQFRWVCFWYKCQVEWSTLNWSNEGQTEHVKHSPFRFPSHASLTYAFCCCCCCYCCQMTRRRVNESVLRCLKVPRFSYISDTSNVMNNDEVCVCALCVSVFDVSSGAIVEAIEVYCSLQLVFYSFERNVKLQWRILDCDTQYDWLHLHTMVRC